MNIGWIKNKNKIIIIEIRSIHLCDKSVATNENSFSAIIPSLTAGKRRKKKKKRNEEIDPERRREITGEHYRDAARFHEFREIFISNSRPDARISIIYTLLVIPSGIRFGYPSLSLARAGKNNSWIVPRLINVE